MIPCLTSQRTRSSATCYSDPALPPGLNAEKIYAGIDVAAAKIAEKGWVGDICNIAPDDDGIATLEKQLASTTYDCPGRRWRLAATAKGSVDV
jgi:hypothetical protein